MILAYVIACIPGVLAMLLHWAWTAMQPFWLMLVYLVTEPLLVMAALVLVVVAHLLPDSCS